MDKPHHTGGYIDTDLLFKPSDKSGEVTIKLNEDKLSDENDKIAQDVCSKLNEILESYKRGD